MKNFLVIGNPIDHSLSPKLHNYWFKKNNIDANYDKRKIDKREIYEIVTEIKDNKLDKSNVETAKVVGKLVAERALEAGIKSVVFDRSGYLYHGKIKAIAESAREAGLEF